MGLIDFLSNMFKSKDEQNHQKTFNSQETNGVGANLEPLQQSNNIPKDIFIEENILGKDKSFQKLNTETIGIDKVYQLLQEDYESIGYQDSFSNPDDNYKDRRIRMIKLSLHIAIEREMTYYDDLIKDINFQLEIKVVQGLVTLIQELNAKKEQVEERKQKLQEMKEQIEKEEGVFTRVKFSYESGFLRGINELIRAKILDRRI